MRVMLVVFNVSAIAVAAVALHERPARDAAVASAFDPPPARPRVLAPPVGTTRYPPGELRVGTPGECPGGQRFTVSPRGHGVYFSGGVSNTTTSDGWVEIWCADLDDVEG